MSGRLEGKVALITGGTSGIGARTGEIFIKEGASIVIAGRSRDRGESLAEWLGANAAFRQVDVAMESDVKAAVDHAVERFGRLDCLFNNAGHANPGDSIEDIAWDDYVTSMHVLVGAVLMGMKHAAPIMRRQGAGSIINNASIAGLRAGYASHIYTAAKAAVIQLTSSVAVELGESGVRVNAISPGAIATPIFGRTAGMAYEAAKEASDRLGSLFSGFQPIPRMGLPDDIAHAAVFLASDESSFVNGHNLVVDGGAVAGRGWSAAQAFWDKMDQAMTGG